MKMYWVMMIVIVLGFIFLINFKSVSADACDTTYLANHTKVYYMLEEAGFDYADEVGTNDFDAGNSPDQTTAGIISNGQQFELSNSDYLDTSTSTVFENDDWTFNVWINISSSAAHGTVFNFALNGANWYGCYSEFRSTNFIFAYCYTGIGAANFYTYTDDDSASSLFDDGKMYMVTYVYTDGTAIDIYRNATESLYDFHIAGNIAYSGGNHHLQMSYEGSIGGTRYLDGMMDEISLFDVALNQTCIDYLYNNHAPTINQQYPYVGAAAGEFTVTWNSFTNLTYSNDTTPTISYDFDSTDYGSANCTLYRNGTSVNWTITDNATTDYLSDLISTDTLYVYQVECVNTTSNNTGYYHYVLDTTYPTAYISYPADNVHYNDYNWSVNINVTDENINTCAGGYSGGDLNNLLTSLSCGVPGCYWTVYYWNFTAGTTWSTDKNETVNLTCTDKAGQTVYNSSMFYTDWTLPTITVNTPVDVDYLIYDGMVDFNVSFYDKYLWRTNVTVFYSNDTIAYNTDTENNSIDYQDYTWLYNFNATTYGFDTFMALFEATDKHTASWFDAVLDYEIIHINDKNDKYIYHMPEGNISFTYPNTINITTVTDTDRWRQRFEYYSEELEEIEIEVEAFDMVWFNDSTYGCHLAIYDKYWYDCEGLDYDTIKFSRKPDLEWNLKFKYYPNTSRGYDISDSLGGLNYINHTLYFTLFNTTASYITNCSTCVDTIFNTTIDCNKNYTENTTGYLLQEQYCTFRGDRKMILAAIILLPMLLGFVLLFASFFLGDDHSVLKIFLFLLTPVTFWMSLNMGMASVVKYYDFPEMEVMLGRTGYWTGMIFFILIFYYFIYMLIKAAAVAAQKKKEKLNY